MTIQNLPLSVEDARRVVEKITSIQIEDGITFEIKSAANIMDEADYAGVRVMLNATFEAMHTPLKIDLSTGDVITPRAVSYSFKLLFEDRSISILAYNLETVLAEKLETLLSRGTANTRMRDFYDVYALETMQQQNVDSSVLREAFVNTCKRRGSQVVVHDAALILDEIKKSKEMESLWKNYQRKFDYAVGIEWDDVNRATKRLYSMMDKIKVKRREDIER